MSYIERYKIRCPLCGEYISMDLSKCPKCGAKIKVKKRSLWWIKLTVAAMLCAAGLLFAAYICWRGGIGGVITDFANKFRTESKSAVADENNTVDFFIESESENTEYERVGELQIPTENDNASKGNSDVNEEFELIFSEYSIRMKDATPELINEMTEEIGSNRAGFSVSAKICTEKIKKLSEISGEGTAKMSELIKKATREKYELYSLWSSKLNEVYKDESNKIMTAYSSLISDLNRSL